MYSSHLIFQIFICMKGALKRKVFGKESRIVEAARLWRRRSIRLLSGNLHNKAQISYN